MVEQYLESKRAGLFPELSSTSERRFYELEIGRWKASEERKNQILGESYYLGKHDILSRTRRVIGPDGSMQTVDNLPNNRIVDNQYAKMVDQKANYLLGKRFVFNTRNDKYKELLGGLFDSAFYSGLLTVGESSLNCGVGWLYVYTDAGALAFKRFRPWEILPLWEDDAQTSLKRVIRVYEQPSWEGDDLTVVEKVEIYSAEGVEFYELVNGALIPSAEQGPLPYSRTESGEAQNWGGIPIIPFKYNSAMAPLITKVKTLQDALNATLSDFQNNMQEDSRNTILILKNYDGENLSEFRRNLAVYGAIKVNTSEGAAGDVTALTVEVNPENYRVLLTLLKKAIIENAMGYDAKDDKMSGAPNQMNILSMYNDIDLDANKMEMEYQMSLKGLLALVNTYLNLTGYGDFSDEEVEIVFNRDMMMNVSEVVQNIKNSEGLLSEETLVSQHPWVTDVRTELERKAEEREASAGQRDAYESDEEAGEAE